VVEGSAALWFSASGFELLDVIDDGVELVVEVQTSTTVVGCLKSGCARCDRTAAQGECAGSIVSLTLRVTRDERGPTEAHQSTPCASWPPGPASCRKSPGAAPGACAC